MSLKDCKVASFRVIGPDKLGTGIKQCFRCGRCISAWVTPDEWLTHYILH